MNDYFMKKIKKIIKSLLIFALKEKGTRFSGMIITFLCNWGTIIFQTNIERQEIWRGNKAAGMCEIVRAVDAV